MTEDQLEQLGRAFYAAFDENKPEMLDDVLAADWQPLPPVPGNPGGREGQKGTLAFLHRVFDDLRYEAQEVIVAENKIVCRALLSGKQTGDFLGVAPTGRRIEMMTIEIHTIENDLIMETWHIEDFFGAHQQLTAK